MMETMYTLLGTSQQPKLLGGSNERLFVVTQKPLTPLPTIEAEKAADAPVGLDGKHRPLASAKKKDRPKTSDKKLTFEMGKRVKRNGTTATTVKVVFPGSPDDQDSPDDCIRSRPKVSTKRSGLRKTGSVAEIYHHEASTNGETQQGSEERTSKSFTQIHTMGGKEERELEDIHSNCMHPHVTRVDILFKPLPNSAESGEEDHGTKAMLPKRRRPVNRQLTKHPSFGSKDSVSLGSNDQLVRPVNPDIYVEREELSESTESSIGEGTWDSNAYTAKNTRIEFARTLHVPRPFVLRRNHSRWPRRKPQERVRLCSRHLQHIRSFPPRVPSPHLKDLSGCPDQFRDPWMVTPTQRRFEPARPIALTPHAPRHTLNKTGLQSNGMLIGPSHPHLNLAAINSVYNCNRLSLPGTVTPPVSETDSLEYLDDFEAFNLKVKMDLLINKFRQLTRD